MNEMQKKEKINIRNGKKIKIEKFKIRCDEPLINQEQFMLNIIKLIQIHTFRTTGELTEYLPIKPTGNIDTRFVYLISLNSLKSNVLSSSPKYKTLDFLPFCRIQLIAARRFATPLGAGFFIR